MCRSTQSRDHRLSAVSPKDSFCELLANSLGDQSFAGFTLTGPKVTEDKNLLRGRVKRVHGRPLQLKSQRCVQVTFKFHGATDIAKNYGEDEVVVDVVRPLLDGHSIINSEWGPAIEAAIGTSEHASLQGARLDTSSKKWEYFAQFGKKERLVSRQSKTLVQPKKELAHDRMKKRPFSPTDPIWSALGLSTPDGRPKPGKKAKMSQVQKFVEIVSRLIDQVASDEQRLEIYDMGCGRGYLTFALHSHLLSAERNVKTFGIDVRPKLIQDMNEVAKSLNFTGLSFLRGTIKEYVLSEKGKGPVDDEGGNSVKVWLGLHACDTATDDALWSGIVQEADIIVVAPCCHKELRPQLDRAMPESDVLRHGIFRQRWASTLTDSIRVLLLEMAGYSHVQVLEFVQTSDTPQNIMITAVRKSGKTKERRSTDSIRKRLQALAKTYGVTHQALATWMGESLVRDGERISEHHQMPPL
jgi:hypothetical protein